MQEQGHLKSLGHARLALFRVFCLPTIRQQSTHKFLWIIKTDPHLDAGILRELIELLRDLPHAYLVASNVNFRVNENFPGGWRDGAEPRDLAQSRVYTGDRRRLERSMAQHSSRPVLETRLDADDGLHREFLEWVQRDAVRQFQQHDHDCAAVDVLVFAPAPGVALDGSPVVAGAEQSSSTTEQQQHTALFTRSLENDAPVRLPPGHSAQPLVHHARHHHGLCRGHGGSRRAHFCARRARQETAAAKQRRQNAAAVPGCGLADTAHCLRFIEGGFVFDAIRSRSPTSAGMLRMQADAHELHPEWYVNYAFWDVLHESFALQRPVMGWVQEYLTEHLLEVARDNLLGQCTTGHSCKEKARVALEELLASRTTMGNNSSSHVLAV